MVGLTWLLTKLIVPCVREALLALKPHEDRDLHPLLGQLDLALVDRLAGAQQGRLVHVEVDVHRVDRHDRGQQGLVLVDQVAEASGSSG